MKSWEIEKKKRWDAGRRANSDLDCLKTSIAAISFPLSPLFYHRRLTIDFKW